MTSGAASAKAHASYRHEAFFYAGNDQWLAGTVPFIRDGLAADEPVMVAVIAPKIAPLRAALGDGGDRVRFVDMAELGHNPARIIPAWREFVEQNSAGGRPVRGIGEPVWPGRRPVEVLEGQLHEALLNLAVEPDTPMWLRCPYDTEALDPSVIVEAQRSHPLLVEADEYRGSTRYGGADHVETSFGQALPEPTVATDTLVFGADGLRDVRRLLTRTAAGLDLAPERVADLALAAHEIATNSLRHGRGWGSFRIWQETGALVCEVRDHGRIRDPLVGRTHPSLNDEGGRGVWLANQLCDLVQVRSSSHGTVVRLLCWL